MAKALFNFKAGSRVRVPRLHENGYEISLKWLWSRKTNRILYKFDRGIRLYGNHVLWHRRRRCVGHCWTYSLPSPSWPFPPAPCAFAAPPCPPPSPRRSSGISAASPPSGTAGTAAASATSVDPLCGAPDPGSLSRRCRGRRRRGSPSAPCPCLAVHRPCRGRDPCLSSSSFPFCPVEIRYMIRIVQCKVCRY